MQHNKPRMRWGCFGWEHPHWLGTYYPDDLPPDWRLAYYANEAACVLVPYERLRKATPAEVESWRGEVTEAFLFFLQGGDQPLSPVFAAALSEQLGGVLGGIAQDDLPGMRRVAAPEGEAWVLADTGLAVLSLFDNGADLREWRARLAALEAWLGGYAEVALLVKGVQVDPRRLAELRLLSELMGIA